MSKELNYQDSDGCWYPEYEDYVFHQFGYSNYSSDTRDFVIKVLQNLYENRVKSENNQEYDFIYSKTDNELEQSFIEFIHTILSHFDLVEYGTSPRYCWLTEKGFDLIKPIFDKK